MDRYLLTFVTHGILFQKQNWNPLKQTKNKTRAELKALYFSLRSVVKKKRLRSQAKKEGLKLLSHKSFM